MCYPLAKLTVNHRKLGFNILKKRKSNILCLETLYTEDATTVRPIMGRQFLMKIKYLYNLRNGLSI